MARAATQFPPGWENFLALVREKPYYQGIRAALRACAQRSVSVLPRFEEVLKPFTFADLPDIKVVIVGQDPYPWPQQCTGLPFGIPSGTVAPQTLVNLCDEVDRCIGSPDATGRLDRTKLTLEGWARQGVLLLNASMTTEEGVVGAHQDIGWNEFVADVLKALQLRSSPVVVMLWGRAAAQHKELLRRSGGSQSNIRVLTATHPSPLSFDRGPYEERFRGCRHFAIANQWLTYWGLTPIDWRQTW